MANNRRFTGGGPRPDRAVEKREDAKARNEAWSGMSPAKQLAALDRRLGANVGSKRQRARLARAIKGAA